MASNQITKAQRRALGAMPEDQLRKLHAAMTEEIRRRQKKPKQKIRYVTKVVVTKATKVTVPRYVGDTEGAKKWMEASKAAATYRQRKAVQS